MLIRVIRGLAEQEEDPLSRSVLLDLANAMEETPDDPFVNFGLSALACLETEDPVILDAAKAAIRKFLDKSPDCEKMKTTEDA
jgi:hypothetical protein